MREKNGDSIRDLALASRSAIGGEDVRVPGNAAFAAPGMQEEQAANPVEMVVDRLHGRWLWFVVLGAVLAPIFAAAAYFLAPVTYMSAGIVGVKREITPNVMETPDTEALADFPGYVIEQTMLLRAERVLNAAIKDARLQPFSERIQAKQVAAIADGLEVAPQKGTGFITIAVESDDPQFSAAAVNSIMDAYMKIAGPDAESDHTRKVNAVRDQLASVRQQIGLKNQDRLALLQRSAYGTPNLQSVIDDRVEDMRSRGEELAQVRASIARVKESLPAGTEPTDDTTLEATNVDLDRLNPQLPAIRREIEAAKTQLELASKSYGPKHPIYVNVLKRIDMLKAQQEVELAGARELWAAGPGKSARYGELRRRAESLELELKGAKEEIDQLNLTMAQEADIRREMAQLAEEERTFADRLKELETEAEAIRKGRISIESRPEASPKPTKDRRVMLAGVGGMGGFIVSFAVFFLWGTLDKRAYGTRQLISANQGKLLLAGAIPDMKEIDDDREAKDLASNCVHRIRTRIESRRTPGDGYALMVSSPFQGDGKTTLAVALAWSYAESGYRTLLVDCDFIGQALSFQFGKLGQPGVREALQGEEPGQFVVSAGAPTLWILPVGRDRHFGASRVHPTGLRRLFRELRNQYDIIIVDTGPMTASIEALPVASSVDGVVLSLRRGRSRERVDECIADIGSVGAEYLGVVLNYAEKKDCLRYGSVSRMSVEISRALEGKQEMPPRHPLLAAIQTPSRETSGNPAKGAQSAPRDTSGDAAGDAA